MVPLPMPYLLPILKRDPQVAAGPIALVASDMLTRGTRASIVGPRLFLRRALVRAIAGG
jgi:hypothetical protein